MQDGDMVLFVTEDLENKIKLSSPVTKKGDTPSFPGSRSSTPCLYRQALTPQLPPLDHNILNELEMEARKVATSVDALTENLAAILQNVSLHSFSVLEPVYLSRKFQNAVRKRTLAVASPPIALKRDL